VIFYGWRVVAAAFLVLFTAYGAQYSFGVFFAALLDEFGWSRAGLAGVFSLYAAAYSVFAFPAGRLTDRWGPRAVITVGGVFLGVALAAMAGVTRLWQPYVLYGLVAAIGMGTAYVPCSSTVVKWFARRRGLAVGLAGCGLGLLVAAFAPSFAVLVIALTTSLLILTLLARALLPSILGEAPHHPGGFRLAFPILLRQVLGWHRPAVPPSNERRRTAAGRCLTPSKT